MRPTTSLPPARNDAVNGGCHPVHQTLCWVLAGFGLGTVAASAYLLLGGEYFISIPRWAEIVFYPGFLAGSKTAEWGLSVAAAKVVGVLAVGLAYAALTVLVRLACTRLRSRRAAERPRTPVSQ